MIDTYQDSAHQYCASIDRHIPREKMLGSFDVHKSLAIYEEKRFCRSSQFPTEYPSGLAGVIDPYEFRQSIQNINRARRKPFGHKIISCVFLLCLVIGVAVTIAGLVLINNTSIAVWITLTAIGIVVSVLSLILSGCLMINPLSSPGDRLSSAVYAESLKYITRRPIASRWQLSLDWMTAGNSQFGYLGNGYGLTYTLIIDIGKNSDRQASKNASSAMSDHLVEPASYADSLL